MRQYILILLLFVNKFLFSQCAQIIWQDSFDYTLNQWSFIEGDGCDISYCGWGQNELQYYLYSNASIQDSHLQIKAKKENLGSAFYTSAAIITKPSFSISEGYLEVKAKMPIGKGIMPIISLLNNSNSGDNLNLAMSTKVLQFLGNETENVNGQFVQNNQLYQKTFHSYGGGLDSSYNVYGYSWDDEQISWYVNGYLYGQIQKKDYQISPWQSSDSFKIVIAMPVGGYIAGNPNSQTIFPSKFNVEYIKLYDQSERPYLQGKQKVIIGEMDLLYQVINAKESAIFQWELPDDFETSNVLNSPIISGQWKANGGWIKCKLSDVCMELDMSIFVAAEKGKVKLIPLENYDQEALIHPEFYTGNLWEDVMNPSPNTLNTSSLCGKYKRNLNRQYDVLFFETESINDASKFVSGQEQFFLDIYSDAPVGTQIIVQLENSNIALEDNFPTGRHSRYETYTSTQDNWQRLSFELIDQLDTTVAQGEINSIALLFASNSFTDHVYYFDNFDIYGEYITKTKDASKFEKSQIFPNPVSEILYINNKDKVKQAFIYNQKGELISYSEGIKIIDLKYLVSGIYFLHLKFDNESIETLKFIKI